MAQIGRFLAPKRHAREAFVYFPNGFFTVDFSHLGAERVGVFVARRPKGGEGGELEARAPCCSPPLARMLYGLSEKRATL